MRDEDSSRTMLEVVAKATTEGMQIPDDLCETWVEDAKPMTYLRPIYQNSVQANWIAPIRLDRVLVYRPKVRHRFCVLDPSLTKVIWYLHPLCRCLRHHLKHCSRAILVPHLLDHSCTLPRKT